MSKQQFYVNPVNVCTELHGRENLIEVRDCIMNSIRRYYGTFCSFHEVGLQNMIECYMVQIIKNAGRNPGALKLALPPPMLEPRFFVERYFQMLDKEKAYKQCLLDCKNNGDCKLNCYIDMNAMQMQ